MATPRPFRYYAPALTDLVRKNRYSQAVTGRGLTPAQITAASKGAIQAAAAQASEDVYKEKVLSEDIRRQKKSERLTEEQIAAGKRASAIRGVTDLANLGVAAYQLKTSPAFTGAAATVPTATTEAATVGAGAAPATGGAAVTTGTTGAATAETTATVAGGQALTSETAATTGGASAFTSIAVPAGVGLVAGTIAANNGADKQGATFAAALAGGATGAAIGAYGGPHGAVGGFVVGAVVGAISYEVGGGGSVLCTELNRQGYLEDDVLFLDGLYRMQHVDAQTYSGYLRLATPVAGWMKKSKLVTWALRPFIRAWAYEMASRINHHYKGNLLGKLIFKLSPVCKYFGEVNHGIA